MPRDRYYKQSLGTLGVAIKKARVLLVGAGGIGCELLKNLVLSGFGEIHIVDLDTIDLSNLNRQFLFRQEHIKKPKAIVAKETATAFNPEVKIEAHHANIKDVKYGVEWFKSFNLVFNALDNLEARRHVNRMCLLANVILIESGTTGFLGQVQTIKKGMTECYDCHEKETPKTYPVCTIRSTPSQSIHCIVWAKSYLFTEIFGQSEESAEDMDHSEDADNVDEIKKLKEEAEELTRIRKSIDSDDFGRMVFEKIFSTDVKRLRDMEDMWKSRTPPEILSFDSLKTEAEKLAAPAKQDDQRVWNRAESFQVFSESVQVLSKRLRELQAGSEGAKGDLTLSFDKDDEEMLDFVASAANLRCSIFHIDGKSKFEVKQMAGNIVPAIATTNAMTAGLCVLEAYKVLRNQWKKAKLLFLETGPSRAFTGESLKPPNPSCSVCSQASSVLAIDSSRATIKNLVDDVLKEKLGYQDDVTIRNESTVLYDPDFDDNLSKTFMDLNLGKDSLLTIVDENLEKPRVDLSLVLVEQTFPMDEQPVLISNIPDIGHKPTAEPTRNGTSATEPGVTTEGVPTGSAGTGNDIGQGELKRKREEGDVVEDVPGKRGKTADAEKTNGEGAVVVDDSADGPIVLDD